MSARVHDDTDRFGSNFRVTRFCGWRRPDRVAKQPTDLRGNNCAPSPRLRPRSTTSDTVLAMALQRSHRRLGRVDILSRAGKRARLDAFGEYFSTRNRGLFNCTRVSRATKP